MASRRPTTDAMTAKRALECSNHRIRSEARAHKRARTEQFLEAARDFEQTQRSCRFFEGELSTLAANQSSRDCDKTCVGEGFSTILSTLRDQTVRQEEQFRVQCDTWRRDAEEAIRLHESFHCVATAIESGIEKKSHLPLLDQGPETNTVIQGLIADFAGVESTSDIADWIELRALLSQ